MMKCNMEEALSLKRMGFSEEEIEYYRRLADVGESSELERLRVIGDKRKKILDTIHEMEEQIIQLDVLRSEIRRKE